MKLNATLTESNVHSVFNFIKVTSTFTVSDRQQLITILVVANIKQ